MAYDGYLMFGGTEIVNATRTAAYVRNMIRGLSFRDISGTHAIEEIEGEVYDSPLQDDAPWVDESNPATYDFLGLYPLALEGMRSSTTMAEVTESIGQGGYSSNPRDASREIRVRGVLLATSELGLDAGVTWLNAALRPPTCQDHGGSCTGATMCFYAAKPILEVCYRDPNAGDTFAVSGISESSGVVMLTPGVSSVDNRREIILQRSTDDGFIVMLGSSEWTGDVNDTQSGLEQIHGPITMQRTNNVTNPRFANDTDGWLVTNGTLTRVVDGGPSNQDYGEAIPTSGTMVVSTSIGDSPTGVSTLSFVLRGHAIGAFDVAVKVDGVVVAGAVFQLDPEWNSYTLTIPYAGGGVIEIASTEGFDITNVMSERSTNTLAYFDGDTVPAEGYAIEWLGEPHNSRSRLVWVPPHNNNTRFRFSTCGPWTYLWAYAVSGEGSLAGAYVISPRISAEEQVVPYERYMRHVTRIDGPREAEILNLPDGYGLIVDFVLNAGVPYAYTTPVDLLTSIALSALEGVDDYEDGTPPEEPASIIVDPDCPPIPSPPRPPVIVNDCVANPDVWDRYYYAIPATEVSAWAATLPTITITSSGEEVRQVRVRMTPNPFGWDATAVDPFAYCSEFILSYLPANTELVVDATVERAWASVGGARTAPASNLLYGTDSGPMTWPQLECGVPYLMTVDVPAGVLPNVHLSLSLTRRE